MIKDVLVHVDGSKACAERIACAISEQVGGLALVQSSGEAVHLDMPLSAIEHDGPVDLIAPGSLSQR
jgi:hypothetical protein